jgi:hypothetical protein
MDVRMARAGTKEKWRESNRDSILKNDHLFLLGTE